MSRRIVIVRHGERLDKVFGEEWIEKAFVSKGNYRKYNLNMPDSVPVKKGIMPTSYRDEPPLTQVGHLQGYLVGKGLFQEKILRPGFITFVSPALRSIQTATELLRGMGFEQEKETHSSSNSSSNSNVLKVEPSLFEYTGFYTSGMPTFLTLEELKVAGFRVDENYSPFLEIQQLVDNHMEQIEEYYQRSYNFVRHLLDTTDESKDILLVAHGATVDAASRQLFGKLPRPIEEFINPVLCFRVPYAGVGILEEREKENGQGEGGKYWAFKSPGPITLKHKPCHDFEADQVYPNQL